MKTKLLFFFVLISQAFFAQTSTITVFSQEGERFYIIINGVRQNDVAATNVKVTDLEKPNYLLKVIFEDQNIETINTNVSLLDYDEKRVNVTYNLKKDKKGKMKLRINSFDNDVSQAKEVEVVKFHEVENSKLIPESRVVKTETTSIGVNTMGIGVQTTIEESKDNVNVSLNLGGSNLSVTAPMASTTITTSTNTVKDVPSKIVKQQATDKAKVTSYDAVETKTTTKCIKAMTSMDFEKAKASIEKQSFADSQLKVAKQITTANCLSTEQIIAIMSLFSFEENKLDYAKFAYGKCIDKANYYQVNDVFSFSASTDELTDHIESLSK